LLASNGKINVAITNVQRITPDAIKIISERCGNSDPSSKKNGIASALASVTAPRTPESDVSTTGLNLGSCVFLFCFCLCFAPMLHDMYTVAMLDGYSTKMGHHLNINVFNRDTLLDAMDHPEEYPQLTIRVSGYAVNFIKLTREQQLDVIHRTMHESM
uniref:glycine radical domain-containing protein n=1 Tax=Listeria monocytogenes TaxID=1639 RepID=UPI0032048DD5